MSSWQKKFSLGVFFLGVVFFLFVVFRITLITVDNNDESDSQFAKIKIVLNGVNLDDVNGGDKDTVYDAEQVILLDGDGVELDYGAAEIKGRGNYTWLDDKKPYQIKFAQKQDLYGLGRARKWNLITNNMDDSLIRNDLAQYIAGKLGMKYIFKGKFVQLSIDNEDLGLYYLTHAVSIGKNAVDLRDEFGILVEVDNLYCVNEEWYYETSDGNCLTIKDTVNDDHRATAIKDFIVDYERLESAAKMGDMDTVRELVDIESMAEYFIISEFSVNPDAYSSSYYFYKDGIDDVIHLGPAWDFDSAFGNKRWGEGKMNDDDYGPWLKNVRMMHSFGSERYEFLYGTNWEKPDKTISRMMYYLSEIPDFMEIVREIYIERLSTFKLEIMDYIGELEKQIYEVALQDTKMWNKNDFSESVEYLAWWVEQRFRLYDDEFSPKINIELKERKY